MNKAIILSLSLLPCAASSKASESFYATASGGLIIGSYNAALEAKPHVVHNKSRQAFSPSVGLGYRLSKQLSLETALTGNGSYSYDYEYGLSPFIRPGDVVAQVTQRLLIKERLLDLAFRMPFHFRIGQRLSVDIIPGLNRQMRRVEYFSRSVSVSPLTTNPGAAGSPQGVLTASIRDTALFSENLGRFGVEAGLRCSVQASRQISLFGAYRYAPSMRVQLSTFSLGATVRF